MFRCEARYAAFVYLVRLFHKSRNYPLQVRLLPSTGKRLEETSDIEDVSVSKLIDIAVLHLIGLYDQKDNSNG